MVEDKLFWSRVVKSDGCWEWGGGVDQNGYGKVGRAGRMWFAHRYSYTISKGEIPHGMVVMHSCDNRRCVNPEHLSVGTHQDNMRDKAEKGTEKGSKHPAAKLSEEDAYNIRSFLSLRDFTCQEIGEMFGVHASTVKGIKYGVHWTHVVFP